MPRMRILSPSEQETFDRPPQFGHRERKRFFEFPQALLSIARNMRSPDHRIGFLTSCGYFRATRRFFAPADFTTRDLAATTRSLGMNAVLAVAYPDRSRQRHQQLILDHYGFSPFGAQAEAALASEIAAMAQTHLKPRLIFDRCVDFLVQQRFQIPRSGSLIELIRSGLHERKAELVALMEAHLTDDARALLDSLFTAPEDQNRYRLTLLRKIPQSTRPSKVGEAVADLETLTLLHGRLEEILSVLGLGSAGVRYFAGSVLRSRVFQLQRRKDGDRYIHAAAFVEHQFCRSHDNLIDLWLRVMAGFQSTALRQHADRMLETRSKHQEQVRSAVDALDTSVFGLIRDIRSALEDNGLSDALKVAAIRSLLNGETSSASFESLKADLEAAGNDRGWYEILEKRSRYLQNRLSPILRTVTFRPAGRAVVLGAAIDHFKATDGSPGPDAPTGFLRSGERAALNDADGKFRVSLYKTFLFQHVAAAIKSGDLNLAHSYRYRPMDAYLIDAERWREEKPRLLERAGLDEFARSGPVLAALNDELARQYQRVNANAPANLHLKPRADGSFHIATPGAGSEEEDPLEDLFPRRHDVPLARVLETVNNYCGILGAFEHWQQTRGRLSTSRPVLLAGIMGLGCGIGVRKMARISSRITESELEHAVNWRFSLENIRAANDVVLKAMDGMELPDLYRRDPGETHTASDGQKFEVRGESLLASRSFRYFGQGQGVSAYTFVDERNFLWHSLIISAADRESAYVIDGLMRNDVVKSDIHSTDTHGYTEAVFGLTHLLGFSFAPRIKSIDRLTRYIFRPIRQAEEDWIIRFFSNLLT